MDRQQMMEALNQLGFDTSTVTDAVPDEVLAEILRGYEQQTDGGAEQQPADADHAEQEPPGTEAAAGMEQGVEAEAADRKMDDGQPPPREDMIAALEQAGYDRAALDAADDETLRKEYEEVSKMDDSQMAPDGGGDQGTTVTDGYAEGCGGPAKPPAKMSERSDVVILKMSEVAGTIEKAVNAAVSRALKTHEQKLNAVAANTTRLARDSKIKSVRTFCELHRDQFRIPPAEFDRTLRRLLRADNNRVQKFSEGGKTVMQTELDAQMAEIEARNPIFGGEQFRAGGAGGEADPEVQKLKNHCAKFSERIRKTGQTEADMLKAFTALRRKNPDLTAEEFTRA